ncbi:MAG: TGS domain-containing protein [Bacteroidota bacterium]|nr:TGS domain-containing protein [Bacteroidota bacterium]
MKLIYQGQPKNQIDLNYRKLLQIVNPSTKDEFSLLRKAFTQYKSSIEKTKADKKGHKVPEIAEIVIEQLALNPNCVISIVVYLIVKNNFIKKEEVEVHYNKDIDTIVSGLISISELQTDHASIQTENFIKLLLTYTTNVKIILLKLAERLMRMRYLVFEKEKIRREIATQIYYLYAPIAHRLGFYYIKQEIEDLYVRYTEPKKYKIIKKKIKESKVKYEQFVNSFIMPLKLEFDERNMSYSIKWRTKSIHSILKKIEKQNLDFEKIYDIFAIRIVLNSKKKNEVADCWHVYSIITNRYKPKPERLRDWITIPKESGYESLHTTVLGYGNRWVEVQIRSKRMDNIAEKGIAAHWKYKGGKAEKEFTKWLKNIREKLDNGIATSIEQYDGFEPETELNDIFIFTPRGDLKKLPLGSTILDFAYSIHTDIGNSCISARVNKKVAPLKYELKSGDRVEIVTSRKQSPKPDWMNYVFTSRAKSKIKRALEEKEYSDAETGKGILLRKIRNWKIKFDDKIIVELLKYYNLNTSLALYSKIANEKIELSEIKEILQKPKKKGSKKKNLEDIKNHLVTEKPKAKAKSKDDVLLIDDDLKGVNFNLAKCCNPIKGDKITGFVTIGKGITIHRKNCPNLNHMLGKYPYREVKASWSDTKESISFGASIKVIGSDEVGIIKDITEVISTDLAVNMKSINVDSSDGYFNGNIKLDIKDTSHLDELLKKLLRVKGVTKAVRVERKRGR